MSDVMAYLGEAETYRSFHRQPLRSAPQPGVLIEDHSHRKDHMAVLGAGRWQIKGRDLDGRPYCFDYDVAPNGIETVEVAAGVLHGIVYLGPSEQPPIEGGMMFCLFANYDANGFLPNPKEALPNV